MAFVDKSVVLLLPVVISLHLYFAPYTKVEESFNIQAVHDILTYGVPLSDSKRLIAADYDHMSFPGAVPRTFVGALVLSEMSRPFIRFLSSPAQVQTLGEIFSLSLCKCELITNSALDVGHAQCRSSSILQDSRGPGFRPGGRGLVRAISKQSISYHVLRFTDATKYARLPFEYAQKKWMARTLGAKQNTGTFALASFILANYGPVPRRIKRARLGLYLLTIAGVIFRSELAILVAAYATKLVLSRRVSFARVVTPTGLGAATIGILVSVAVDSFFWQRFPLWPEWSGFYFNTLLGRSASWGTSPFHFYFLNALPRLLLNPTTLVCIGFAIAKRPLRDASLDILGPSVAFVGIYSFLPHKEWRFVIYTVPALTAVASAGAAWIWTRRARSHFYRLLSLALIVSIPASFALSTFLLYVSSLNYPGAYALNRLHALEHGSKSIMVVHLDDLSCQTGVTRFQEMPSVTSVLDMRVKTLWSYDKTEEADKLLDPKFWRHFDYVIAESPDRIIGQWSIVKEIYGYAGIGVVKGEPTAFVTRKNAQLNMTGHAYLAWKQVEYLIRKYLTGGRWLEVKLEPRLKILKNQMPTWEQRYAESSF